MFFGNSRVVQPGGLEWFLCGLPAVEPRRPRAFAGGGFRDRVRKQKAREAFTPGPLPVRRESQALSFAAKERPFVARGDKLYQLPGGPSD